MQPTKSIKTGTASLQCLNLGLVIKQKLGTAFCLLAALVIENQPADARCYRPELLPVGRGLEPRMHIEQGNAAILRDALYCCTFNCLTGLHVRHKLLESYMHASFEGTHREKAAARVLVH